MLYRALVMGLTILLSPVLSAQTNALFFDGNDDQVIIPADATTAFGAGDFTIEMWVYIDDVVSDYGGIATTYYSNQGGWAFHRDFDVLRFGVGVGASAPQYLDVTTTISADTWMHVAGVRESNVLYLYIDGTLVGTQTSPHSIQNYPIHLGRRYVDYNTWYDNSMIDEFRVWNYARSESEIIDKMNCEIDGDEAGLVRYYRFNQGIAAANNTAEVALISNDLDNPVNGTFYNMALNGSVSNFVNGQNISSCIPPVPGCTDSNSCQYDPAANTDDGSCVTFIGDPCDDGNPLTVDDVLQSNCSCSGITYPTPPGSGDALAFDGLDDKLVISDDLTLDDANRLTIETWVKFDQFPSGTSYTTAMPIFSKWITSGSPSGTNSYLMIERGGFFEFYVANASGWQSFITTSHNFQLNKWHHLACVFDNGQIQVYVDGIVLLDVTSTVLTIGNGSQPLKLGDWYKDFNPLYASLNGQLDEFRLWKDAALSQSEIREYMCQKDLSSHPYWVNLNAYYRFDDGVGSTEIKDLSGNGNHGSLTNMDPATDWVTSGAPIGDQSVQTYGGSTLSLTDGTIFTADTYTGSPTGVHVYKVNEAPNDVTVPANYTGLETTEYYGVHLVGGSSPSYSATLDYSGNSNIDGAGNEDLARLASRDNNASGAFADVSSQSIDPGTNTIVATGQTGTEYIPGFSLIPGCTDPNSCEYDPAAEFEDGSCVTYIGDTCDDGNPLTVDDVLQSNCSCSGTVYSTPPGSGDALSFDGLNDYSLVQADASLEMSTSITLEAWVYVANSASANAILTYGIQGGGFESYTFEHHPAVGPRLRIAGSTDIHGGSTDFLFSENEWHHMAISWDGITGEGNVYMDGELVHNQTNQTGSIVYSGPRFLYVGSWYGNERYWSGQLDEVRIWSSVLSESEIRDHMCQKDLSSHPSLANLEAYYRFDDGVGSPNLIDLSGNSNHGSLVNMDSATDWVTSGAPIGDQSVQTYGGSSLTLTDGTIFTADTYTGSPTGVHVYKVNEAPNDVTVPANYTGLETTEYYGVHLVGGSSPSYSATLDYSGNSNIDGAGNEDLARLASRDNNASGAFADVSSQSIDTGANTITVTAQTGTEYIPGFFDEVTGCIDASACNYNDSANTDDGSCLYASICDTCSGETDGTGTVLVGDTDGDGVCNTEDCAPNDPAVFEGASCDDGDPTTEGDVILSNCSCVGTSILGCTDPAATNYNINAGVDDGSCAFCMGSVVFDATLPDPIVIGSGISNEHMAISSDCAITAGIKAFERFVGDVVPVAPGNSYRFLTGESPTSGVDPTPDPGTARWNYLLSINLGTLTFEQVNVYLDIDFDPADGVGQTGPFTADISQTMIDNGLGATSLVQDSQNLGFGFWQAIGSPDILPFDPFANGVYELTLRVESLTGTELINIPIRVEVYTPGCIDPMACNYNENASEDDGSCIYPDTCDSCSGETDGTGVVVDGDADEDGICDVDEILGCQDPIACNYNINATDAGACTFASGCDFCSGESDGTGVVVIGDTDGDGICDLDELPGCSDPLSCDYNPAATDDDGSCLVYPGDPCDDLNAYTENDVIQAECSCAGTPIDTDGDGISDQEEVETWGSDPTNADSDGDGLTDGLEINGPGTSPTDPDTDGDGCTDDLEFSYQCPDSEPCDEPGCTGDLNGDNIINTGDLTLLLGQFGLNCP